MPSELERDIYGLDDTPVREIEVSHHQLHQLINVAAGRQFKKNMSDSGNDHPAYATDTYTNYAIIHTDDRDLSVPYALTGDGTIQFGEPTPVVQTYIPGRPTGDGDGDADDGVMAPAGTPSLF